MTALISSRPGLESCEPRYATPRTAERRTFGHRLIRVAEALGTPFMPWQQQVALVGGELVHDPETGLLIPAYPEVVVTVMRQQGKTTVKLSWAMDRLVLWESWDGRPNTVGYSAQSGADARQKFREDWVPALQNSPLWPAIKRPRYAAENSGLDMRSGGWLNILSNSNSAGHGKVIDLALMDEIFSDSDNSREQAMVPAMATRHDSQSLMSSTAGDDTSTFLLSKQRKGRAAVNAGDTGSGIAYFEWSADETEDPEDPRTWWSCMPALGHTITERTVSKALRQMRDDEGDEAGLAEFRRAWLNIPKRAKGERVINDDMWAQNIDEAAEPARPLTFAVEVSAAGTHAAIVAADREHRAELVDYVPVAHVVDRVDQLSAKWRAPVVVQVTGQAAWLPDVLESKRVNVERYGAAQFRAACSWVLPKLADGELRVRPSRYFDLAILAAAKRPSGDAFVWDRKSTDELADVSSLVSLTLAAYHAATAAPRKPIAVRR